jgi:hypothetical protein
MKLIRQTAKYGWEDYKRNGEKLDELKDRICIDQSLYYRKKWICHIAILHKVMMKYTLTGTRNRWRPLKRDY